MNWEHELAELNIQEVQHLVEEKDVAAVDDVDIVDVNIAADDDMDIAYEDVVEEDTLLDIVGSMVAGDHHLESDVDMACEQDDAGVALDGAWEAFQTPHDVSQGS